MDRSDMERNDLGGCVCGLRALPASPIIYE